MNREVLPKGDNQPDLFAACFSDIAVRDQRDTMERPFFSLSKRRRYKPIEYKVGDTVVEVSANPQFGMATIWDADILIWASTQITEAIDRGLNPSRRLQFHPYDLLKSIRRGTGGREYKLLRSALDRLTHTAVRTNIRAQGKRKFVSFHWLDSWTENVDEKTGETTGMEITIPDWLYQGVVSKGGILTIHEDYFVLTSGVERVLYRIARKHAGMQDDGWQFTMRQLYEKAGSLARFSDFALDVRKAITKNNIPEYSLELTKNKEGVEIVHMVRRSKLYHEDMRFEAPRHPRRRMAGGITQKAWKPNEKSE